MRQPIGMEVHPAGGIVSTVVIEAEALRIVSVPTVNTTIDNGVRVTTSIVVIALHHDTDLFLILVSVATVVICLEQQRIVSALEAEPPISSIVQVTTCIVVT